jgi:mRNA-degrading endonuclease RelE of RelBE toxin-antitoxin system
LAARLNEITFRATALREFESLPRPVQELAAEVITSLTKSDMPKGAMQMRDQPDLRRIYVGKKHRLIYSAPRKGEIEILRIRARAVAYIDLDKLDPQ